MGPAEVLTLFPSIGQRIIHAGIQSNKAILAECSKTNNWLADQLSMNRTTVSKWCRNEMQPRVETLFQIARMLDVEVRKLLGSSK